MSEDRAGLVVERLIAILARVVLKLLVALAVCGQNAAGTGHSVVPTLVPLRTCGSLSQFHLCFTPIGRPKGYIDFSGPDKTSIFPKSVETEPPFVT